MYQSFKQTEATANSRGVMETGNHLKNGASPKSHTSKKNLFAVKWRLITLLLFLGTILPATAQTLPFFIPDGPMKKPQFIPIIGGKDGKEFAAIIHTELDKKELVAKTSQFLSRWDLVDTTMLKLDEIDDETAEYAIPFMLPQSFAGMTMMGMARVVHPPVILKGNLRFEFHANGNVLIVWDDISELAFYLMQNGMLKEDHSDPDISEYAGHYAATLMEGTAILKLLIVMNRGIDGLREYTTGFDEYFNDIKSKYAVLEKVQKKGKGEWLTDSQFLETAANTKLSDVTLKYQLPLMKNCYDEGRVLAVNQKRWDENIRPVIADLFKAVSSALDGEILGVAEDRVITHVEMNDMLMPVDPAWTSKTPPAELEDITVPTDPKVRDKYIKKNKKKAL
jgi:hypothetical protein